MRRKCLHCGTIFESTHAALHCPDCVEKLREQNKWHVRACASCGMIFMGGPRAIYCPGCRIVRKRQQHIEYHERKRRGAVRELGSADLCENCGKAYVVESGLQRYCPECGKQLLSERQRESASAYYAEHRDPNKRSQIRKKSAAQIPCVICGTLFHPKGTQKTCSAECKEILYRQTRNKYTPEKRAEWRENVRKKQASLSPDEKELFHLKTNERKRKNYHAAREKEKMLSPEEREQLRMKRNQKARERYAAKKKEQQS